MNDLSESQRASAEHLESEEEQEYWFLQYAKNLCASKNQPKIRALLDSLIDAEKSENPALKVMLNPVLEIVGNNLELQRLYMEYQERIETQTELMEVNASFV